MLLPLGSTGSGRPVSVVLSWDFHKGRTGHLVQVEQKVPRDGSGHPRASHRARGDGCRQEQQVHQENVALQQPELVPINKKVTITLERPWGSFCATKLPEQLLISNEFCFHPWDGGALAKTTQSMGAQSKRGQTSCQALQPVAGLARRMGIQGAGGESEGAGGAASHGAPRESLRRM